MTGRVHRYVVKEGEDFPLTSSGDVCFVEYQPGNRTFEVIVVEYHDDEPDPVT